MMHAVARRVNHKDFQLTHEFRASVVDERSGQANVHRLS